MGVDHTPPNPHPENGYIPTVLGAYLGALVIGGPIAGVSLLTVGELVFSDVTDAALIAITTTGAAGVVVGSGTGATWMLRRRHHTAAAITGTILASLLTILFLVGLISAGTAAQSSWFVPLGVAAMTSPLVARWLAIQIG
ncbi:MAG: hypothetical protein H0U53_06930 [Actinobacteria bacterium]|nr:hypothetical protein [Actinomycetota bacterium]